MSETVLTYFSTEPSRSPKAAGADAPRLRELDRVIVLETVTGDDGSKVPEGSDGTIVGVWRGGEAFEVEFTYPVDALATVQARLLHLFERAEG